MWLKLVKTPKVMKQLTLEDLLNGSQNAVQEPEAAPVITMPIAMNTLVDCEKIRERVNEGDITVTEMQQAFEALVKNKEFIVTQLQKLKKDDLQKIIGGFNRNDTKPEMVKSAWYSLMKIFVPGSFSWSMFQETIEQAITREVYSLTDEKFQEIIADRKERRAAFIKSLANPETLDEYRTFVSYRGVEKLSEEQRILYEELSGERTRDYRKSEASWKASLGELDLPEGVELSEVQHTCHTKHGYDLYVVSINQRVDRALFDQISKRAVIYGGSYSSYSRDGAIAGWQFRESEKAIQFRQLDKIDGSDRVENAEQYRKQKAVRHLLEVSGNLKSSAKEVLSVNRLTNTHRRVRMANSVEGAAFYDIQLAGTMKRLAEAIACNEVSFIDRIMYKVEIEDFETMLRHGQYARQRSEGQRYCSSYESYTPLDVSFIDYPFPHGNKNNLLEYTNKLKDKPGLKLVCNRIIKKIQNDPHEYLTTFKYSSELDDLRKLLSAVKKHSRSYGSFMDMWQESLLTYDRMIRLELRTVEELRTALREYLQFRGSKPTQDAATILRRQIVGMKIPGYFPTPKAAAAKLVELANIKQGMTICDPNAGTGHLLDVVCGLGISVTSIDAVEINSQLQGILEACGYHVAESDFMSPGFTNKYDRFVANPAFEGANDVHTVMKMYRLLNPRGKISAIVSEACFSNSRAPYTTFREWFYSLPETCRTEEKLPQGTFLESDVRTGVNTRLITISKS